MVGRICAIWSVRNPSLSLSLNELDQEIVDSLKQDENRFWQISEGH